jgi:hypothetical protein
MDQEKDKAFSENQEMSQKTLETMCNNSDELEELTLEHIKSLLHNTGLETLPPNHTKTHDTLEIYFQTVDGAICHLIFVPQVGFELDVYSKSSTISEGEFINLKLLKRMSELVNLNITDVLRNSLERLIDS